MRGRQMDVVSLISEVGFPIAGALAAGYLVFLTISAALGIKGVDKFRKK